MWDMSNTVLTTYASLHIRGMHHVFNLEDFQSSETAVLRVHDVTSRVANALPLQIPVICKRLTEVWTPP